MNEEPSLFEEDYPPPQQAALVSVRHCGPYQSTTCWPTAPHMMQTVVTLVTGLTRL